MLESVDQHVGCSHVVQEATRYSRLSPAEALPDGVDEVPGKFVLDVQLGVARELDGVGAPDVVLRKDLVEVVSNEVVQEHDLVLVPSGRQRNEARHLSRGDLDELV